MHSKYLSHCTLGEVLIYQISLTVEDGTMAFHGFGSPLVQSALHLAKNNHAPDLVLIAGATYGVNPHPPFLTPTSNDWAMNCGAECHLDIEELFDLAASGRLGRMFLSGLQIDRYGNMNVTRLGQDTLKLKLPGGGGGCNLSCDSHRVTIWTAAHRANPDSKGQRRFRLVDQCDFITSVGHQTVDGKSRKEMGYPGMGPDTLVTELGVFDFDASGHARLISIYPDTDLEIIQNNTGFTFPVSPDLSTVSLPNREMVEFLRTFDPLNIHEREFKPDELNRFFPIT